MPTLLEVSTQVHQDLGSPDSPTVGVIQYWLRHHVTDLNNAINTSYTISATDGSIEPDLGDQESSIIKRMYMVYFYDHKIRENLGAAAIDPVLEVAENGAVVRMVSRNNLALSYVQMKKAEKDTLDQLIHFYRTNSATPQSVEGDDTTDVDYDGTNPIRSTSE